MVGPMAFEVDVDGEVFNVKISPLGGDATPSGIGGKKEISPNAIPSLLAGIIMSINVEVNQTVRKGDVLATIEAMKMMREVTASYDGVVKEIMVNKGAMVQTDDILMVVEPIDE